MYHPKTDDLATTIGYEIYYKGEDDVNFKDCTTNCHFLGKVWVDDKGTPATEESAETPIKGTKWDYHGMTLDNKVAEKNTERIAHRVRMESSWQATKYLMLNCGGVYTFAGKNMPREGDVYCGGKVRF